MYQTELVSLRRDWKWKDKTKRLSISFFIPVRALNDIIQIQNSNDKIQIWLRRKRELSVLSLNMGERQIPIIFYFFLHSYLLPFT